MLLSIVLLTIMSVTGRMLSPHSQRKQLTTETVNEWITADETRKDFFRKLLISMNITRSVSHHPFTTAEVL